MSRRLELGLVSHIDDIDRLTFLSDVNIEPFDDTSNTSSSRHGNSINALGRIVESFEKDHVLITKCIAMNKRAWEIDLYAEDVAGFPILDVPIKCDVISELVQLLRSDKSSDDSCLNVIKSLQRIIETSSIGSPRSNQSDSTAETRDPSGTPSRIERHFRRLSIDPYWFSNAFGPSKQHRPPLFSTKSTRSTPDWHGEEEPAQRENYTKFPHYKQLITTLYQELCRRDGYNQQNDPLFAQVSDTICQFILQDCKTLLAGYIERKLMS
ncbi:ZYRO0B03872p [Zygosaccharomyces rouxii]|uniref:ZYRO0B03872p n=1 Tax=Zygosaccharomyces rouxii (strain ATCC 2623 / CBS 732 / NBRC 1130 / NCYC 568 / NRRL Y-229) TaxID=559307 RepID=C5DQX9_ZYGRC|nr:uncharacterized protein ZYRO0B03872g [Zygosaccharomyces rouxii]KAH9200261.1 hypothetical protein LQ764DRAFT_114172 [Zygosaccharomyces rouxii]CAR26190.1 ZYRO0B03872p [Zygosaccharomyces rouxii]